MSQTSEQEVVAPEEQSTNEASDEIIFEEAMAIFDDITKDASPQGEDSAVPAGDDEPDANKSERQLEEPDEGADNHDGDAGDSGNGDDGGGDAGNKEKDSDKKKLGEGESEGAKDKGEPEKPKDERVAKRLSLISKKEAELRNQNSAIKEREKAVEVGEKFLTELKDNPFKAIESRLGEDFYERYTKHILNDKKDSPVSERERKLEQRIAELEQTAEGKAKEEQRLSGEESDKEGEKVYTEAIQELCSGNDDFELMNVGGEAMYKEATAYARLCYDKNGTVPDLIESAKAIEDTLRAQAKISAGTKFAASLSGKPKEVDTEVDTKKTEQKQKSLTNTQASTPSTKAPAPDEATEEEILAEAVLEMERQLGTK